MLQLDLYRSKNWIFSPFSLGLTFFLLKKIINFYICNPKSYGSTLTNSNNKLFLHNNKEKGREERKKDKLSQSSNLTFHVMYCKRPKKVLPSFELYVLYHAVRKKHHGV